MVGMKVMTSAIFDQIDVIDIKTIIFEVGKKNTNLLALGRVTINDDSWCLVSLDGGVVKILIREVNMWMRREHKAIVKCNDAIKLLALISSAWDAILNGEHIKREPATMSLFDWAAHAINKVSNGSRTGHYEKIRVAMGYESRNGENSFVPIRYVLRIDGAQVYADEYYLSIRDRLAFLNVTLSGGLSDTEEIAEFKSLLDAENILRKEQMITINEMFDSMKHIFLAD